MCGLTEPHGKLAVRTDYSPGMGQEHGRTARTTWSWPSSQQTHMAASTAHLCPMHTPAFAPWSSCVRAFPGRCQRARQQASARPSRLPFLLCRVFLSSARQRKAQPCKDCGEHLRCPAGGLGAAAGGMERRPPSGARTPPACDSHRQAFWCPLRNQIRQWLGRGMSRWGTEDLGTAKLVCVTLCDPVMVGTCHYTCAWTHRVPNTQGDPEVHCALGDDNCPSPGDADGGGVCTRWGGRRTGSAFRLPRCRPDPALEYKVCGELCVRQSQNCE